MDHLPWVLMTGLAVVASFAYGSIKARNKERSRVVRLCNAALNKRWSGTARWVLNAVHSGSEWLVPENEFFEQTPERPAQKSNCPPGHASIWIYHHGQWRMLSLVHGRQNYYPKPEEEVANEGQLMGDPDLIRAMLAH